jgi:hypothetical protein
MVVALSVWQLASKLAGAPYPEELLYSNPGWAILTTQQMGLVPRINGPFPEPSSLAGYMAGIVCACGWTVVQGNGNMTVRLLLVLGILTMALSTSTTGFGVLAITACGLPIYAVMRGDVRLISGILRASVPLIMLGFLIVLTISVVKSDIFDQIRDVIDFTLNKQDSSSYNERTSFDIDSLAAFVDSFGLGTGWGSNRSSSLLPGLLANIGVPGVAGLIWFVAVLAKHVRRAKRLSASRDNLFVIDACCGSLVGSVLAALLAGPAITSVTFYFLIALLVSCVARLELARGQGNRVGGPQLDDPGKEVVVPVGGRLAQAHR